MDLSHLPESCEGREYIHIFSHYYFCHKYKHNCHMTPSQSTRASLLWCLSTLSCSVTFISTAMFPPPAMCDPRCINAQQSVRYMGSLVTHFVLFWLQISILIRPADYKSIIWKGMPNQHSMSLQHNAHIFQRSRMFQAKILHL